MPHPRTIFRGIRKLPPGHYAVYRDRQLDGRPLLGPGLQRRLAGDGGGGDCSSLQSTLESSVELRMQSDVPLGAFLSGGVDSSLIVAIMQKLAIAADQDVFDRLSGARSTTRRAMRGRWPQHLRTDHHEFQVTPDGLEILPKLVWHFDEPFADSSAIPTWYVSQLTREHVTVSLTGDGGDELFVGYPRYRAVALGTGWIDLGRSSDCSAAPFWQSIPSSARQKSKLRQFKRFSEALAAVAAASATWTGSASSTPQRRAMLYDGRISRDSCRTRIRSSFSKSTLERIGRRDPVTAISLTDLQTYLPCDLMTKVDIASMAHALECRQPFLDVRVGRTGGLLSARLEVPRAEWASGCCARRSVICCPTRSGPAQKMGFGVPLDHWFRDELKELTHDVLLGETARSRGLFRARLRGRADPAA